MPEKATLDSWKDIARYLRRTEKTCRNWEINLGLPVHRLDGSPKARVFAYPDELDRWKERKLREGESRRAKPRLNILFIPGGAFVVLVLIAVIVWKALPRRTLGPTLAAKKSMAVLPFVDLSSDQSSGLLADGISDALINALSRIRDLRVTARTSAFSFKGQKTDVREVGRILNVEAVLEGSVQVEGERLRVAAQLVDAKDGFPLWSDLYDRNLKMEDIFAVEDDIVRAIVDTMRIRIIGEKPIVKRGTGNLEAYHLYLQGRQFWNKRGYGDLLKSIDYYEKALALDPKYALAYTGLSDTFRIFGINVFRPSREVYPSAREFAEKALEIDDGLAEAYCCLAGVKLDYDWDFAGAERDYRKAIVLSPGDASARHFYALHLSWLGRHQEAIKEIKKARDLDPLAPRIRANIGFVLYNARRYQEAADELRKAIEFDPIHTASYEYLGNVCREIGRYEESIDLIKRSITRDTRTVFLITLAVSYARAGNEPECRRILKELDDRSKKEHVSPAILASVYGSLGESDVAFELLDRAYSDRDCRLIQLKVEPIFDPLRSDSRFAALLKKIGLEK